MRLNKYDEMVLKRDEIKEQNKQTKKRGRWGGRMGETDR